MNRKGGSIDDIELPPWRIVAFTDVHVSTKTIDLVLAVLARVRAEAIERKAMIVFLGDFWETRGQLPVRHLDAILDEFHRWKDAKLHAVIIPGNHDQVTIDGRVHGIRFPEAFPNILVATHRVLWPERRLAFIPWREDPGDQTRIFELPEPGDWTIFAHAEVEGASTNYRHVAAGRVSLEQIERNSRACYVGHYHKRQQLGRSTWYIGSPFEHNFGEMGDPKGLAYITSEATEPEWIPLPGFRRHHRVAYQVPYDANAIRPHDIVEAYVPPQELQSEQAAAWLAAIPAADVRRVVAKTEEKTDEPPAYALTIDQAIDAYIDELAHDADEHGADLVTGQTPETLKQLGRAILAEIPEARALAPLSPKCTLLSVEIVDFCAIRGPLAFDLEKRGLVLLRGKIGMGKTAIADAITWCLTGSTAPRKAGSHSATFRGDEVIHDFADRCSVAVNVRLADGREARIARAKTRGKGAAVQITGLALPDGISDADEAVIPRIIGLDETLWRSCVSLGQGAVGNFVTDADKKRKEALSIASGLTACAPAQEYVRKRMKPLAYEIDVNRSKLAAEERALSELKARDYGAQITLFEDQRNAAKEAARAQGEAAKAGTAECDAALAKKPEWEALKKQHEDHIEERLKALVTLTPGGIAQKERELGGANAEKAILERDLARVSRERAQLQASLDAGPMPCPTCGKPMEPKHAEGHVAEKGHEEERIRRAIETFVSKIRNLAVEIDTLKKGGEVQRAGVEQEISASRQALGQINTALSQFARIEQRREEYQRTLQKAIQDWRREDAAVNPWIAEQERATQRIVEIQRAIDDATATIAQLKSQLEALQVWEMAFSPKGIPVLVLRTLIFELEQYANRFLSEMLAGQWVVQLAIVGEDLIIRFYENVRGSLTERRYEQLSGGQRRCVELAFAPFALSEIIFNRCGVRVPLLIIDELTTHLGQDEKPIVCDLLHRLDRETVLVIDHDLVVQGSFDTVYELTRDVNGYSVFERSP